MNIKDETGVILTQENEIRDKKRHFKNLLDSKGEAGKRRTIT